MFFLRPDVFNGYGIALKIAVTLWVVSAGTATSQAVAPFPKPRVTVNLAKIGWKDSPAESDRSFLRNYSLERLEAQDGGIEIAFLNDSVLVAFHGVQESQEGKDFRTVRRELEAFFIRAEDGAVLFKKRWRTIPRKSTNDAWETEARLIRVSEDRFLIHASGVLMLYSSKDYVLLKEKKLDPAGLGDLWAAQAVPGGRYILLRHGHPSRMYATYEWLESDTLETIHRTQSDSLWSPVGLEDSIVGGSDSGIQRLGPQSPAATICRDESCPKGGDLAALSPHSLAFLARTGVGVIDTKQGLLWLEPIDPHTIPQVDTLRPAASGNRFSFFLRAPKKLSFHGENTGGSFAVFVYDAVRGRPLYWLRSDPALGCALSPAGTQIAMSNSTELKIYSIE